MLSIKEMIENTFVEIFVETAINETPISSGSGEEIIKPANTKSIYFLNVLDNLLFI